MAFNYNKYKSHSDDSFWTSYSDLFLGLSSIFLLLYVVASLRNSTDSLQMQTENQSLKVKVNDLENQLQMYEEVKNNYLNTSAEKSELEEYQELMDKLTLLQDDAKGEKDKLRQEAKENERKELALNKYQKMIRNMINSNKFSKVKISNRDVVINEQDVEITDQQKQITGLNTVITTKEQEIQNREGKIKSINDDLAKKAALLKSTYKKAKLSQKAYQKKLSNLNEMAKQQVVVLKNQNDRTLGELESAKNKLASTQSALASTESALSNTSQQLGQTQQALNQKGQELTNLNGQLAQAAADTQNKINSLKGQYADGLAKEKAAFGAALSTQKNLGAAEIARREAAFKNEMAGKERKLAGEIAGLSGQLKNTEGQLAQVRTELEARKGVAKEIQKGFAAAGIKADIDLNTGDVQIDFGQAHFDNDSSALKEEMKRILQSAVPIYSKSLFGNPKVSDKITAVEIIGFASPTYKGKFVNPKSTRPEDVQALKYNMDLSYKRANSIFGYILDNKDMNFQYRNSLIPSLKVSGRSFLDLMKADRNISSAEDYCVVNDCKKSQRVIIRFSMDKK